MVNSKESKMTPLNEEGILVPYREGFVNLLLVENKEQCKLNFIAKFRQMNFEVETTEEITVFSALGQTVYLLL